MKSINEVRHVAIVGGGTSAWLTAAMLSHKHDGLQVTIIDKEVGTPVGVGEGTLLSFDSVMTQCGFSVEEWFFPLDATYKSGILFPGWGKEESEVWHPFLFAEMRNIETTQMNMWTKNQQYDFKQYGTSMYDVSVNYNKVDRNTPEAYAFHIDASKLVTFIQDKLELRYNVRSIKSEVVEVLRHANNHIDKLILKNGTEIEADLYVDCTGFKGMLNNKPDRVTLENRLFCDTAIAAHVPYIDKEEEMHPYVISEQVEHGWIWNIPVQSRIGSGLVFNRSCTSIDEAKDAFCEYWDHRVKKENLKVIDWTPYYNKNIWHDNVVSIGLSAGFIEPLESTGIALIIAGVEQLSFAISPRYYTDDSVSYYNTVMSNYFEDAIDFVSMHYAKPTRKGKIWDLARATFKKSPRQEFYEQQILRTDTKLPIKGTGYMFCGSNWVCWLIQMGYPVAPAFDGHADELSYQELEWYHDNIEMKRHETAPTHGEYIALLKEYIDAKAANTCGN